MGWLIAAAVLLAVCVGVLYARLAIASRGAHVRQIQAEKFIVPEVTPVPAPEQEEEEAARLTVTYPVPLDQELQDYIVKTALENEVSPCIVFAVIGVESGYDATKKGDFWDGYYHSYGLMQILASKHTDRCLRLNAINLLDPYQNVRVGIDYLAELLDEGKGIEWALSFYNGHGGEPCDYARTVLCNARQIFEGRRVHE